MKEDPRGWFQWYCRYFNGRKISKIDKIQIARWKAFRPGYISAIKKNCLKKFLSCGKKQRQALLQWAYNPFFLAKIEVLQKFKVQNTFVHTIK